MSTKISISLHNPSDGLSYLINDKRYVIFQFSRRVSIENDLFSAEAAAGAFFFRTPDQPLVVRPIESGKAYAHCLAISGSIPKKLFSLCGLESNVIHKPLQTEFADSIFSKLSNEINHASPNWQAVALAYVMELLAKLTRMSDHDFIDALPDHSQKLRDLRAEIHESYSKPWKISDMASILSLSTSRFASLYKSTFKISPAEDLIQTRIDQAKLMLSRSKVSVKKVSDACGFESVHYFHRAFKKRTRLTPKHFQNMQLAQSGSVASDERHFSLDRMTQKAEFSGVIEMIDGELRFHGNSSHVAEFIGFSDKELREKSFTSFVSPNDRDIALDAAAKISSGKNVLNLSINLISASGTLLPVLFSALLKGRNWYWFIQRVHQETLVSD